MRKLIVLEHITLDGVIQGPGGRNEDTSGGFKRGGWISKFSDPALGTELRKRMNQPFDLLLGRKTFDIWAPYWPHNGSAWPQVNAATKYVASNTLTSSAWQPTVFLSGDVADKIAKIKQLPGPDLNVWGSSVLIQTLIQHNLIDTFWLMIYPMTLGAGKRLFVNNSPPLGFKATERLVTPSGVMIMNLERTAGR